MKSRHILAIAAFASASWMLPASAGAQTYTTGHPRSLVIPGSGTDLVHTITINAPALLASRTITLPGASLVFPAANAGGILTNDGSGNLTWTPATGGTVTSITIATANGFAGSSSGGATPALTISTTITGLLKGNATAISAASSGTDYSAGTSGLLTGILKSTGGTGALSIAVATDFPALNQNTTGSAASFTGALAGDVTGTQGATAVGKILGNTVPVNAAGALTNNGSGTLSWTPAFSNPMTTTGDILYSSNNSGTPTRLGIGAPGNVLTVVSGLPSWTSTTGSFILNQTATQSSSNFNISGIGVAPTFSGGDAATGGALTVRGGNGSSTTGGALTLSGGTPTSGAGSNISITGTNAATSGAGGAVTVTAGNAAGTNQNGGSIALLPGTATGSGIAGGVGINTSSPNVDLDINGDWASRATSNSTTTTTLNNLSTLATSTLYITNETSPFTITGLANGVNGKRLTLYNKSGQNMTLSFHNSGSNASNQINTLANSDVSYVGNTAINLFYDASGNSGSGEWVVAGYQASGGVQGVVGVAQSVLRATSKNYTTSLLTNDSDFAWNVGANETWEVDGVISVTFSSTGNTPDLGIAVNIPGTPPSIMIGTSGFPTVSDKPNIWISILTANNTVCLNPIGSQTNPNSIVFVHGVFTTGITTGTAYLKFSEPCACGTTTVNSSSYLKVTRLD